MIARHFTINTTDFPASGWLAGVVSWTWRVKLQYHLETDLFAQLRERADAEAIGVFAANLKDLLLAAPAGARPTIGLDPGYALALRLQ